MKYIPKKINAIDHTYELDRTKYKLVKGELVNNDMAKTEEMRILKIVSNLFSEIIFGKYFLGRKRANENRKQVPIINSPNLKPKNVRPTKGLANNIEKKSKKKYIYFKNSINLKSFNILLFKLAYTKEYEY